MLQGAIIMVGSALLFGVTWGGLFLGEPVTAGMLPGCLLVLAAMALVTGFNPFRLSGPR